MPSTFSPALRLELIGNGEQAANWGNTTNTNLGTLLEQAISGVSSVAMFDADHVLISGNGVADEARNAVLIMTGALTATRSVIVPASEKFYAFQNDTTGSQSILIRTSVGTGVTLGSGLTQLMYCDGTNVSFASSAVNSITGAVALNNPTINGFNGDTTAINVGSGQIFKSVAGNVGIGTASPTAKLTVSDGSTQINLAPSSGVGFIGTHSNNPTSLMTNNIERVRVDTSGNVGIGTSAPTQRLDVSGNVQVVGNLNVTGTINSGGGPSSIVPTGVMFEYGGSSLPDGYLFCNGAAISRASFAALFAAIGVAYGIGDGITTFNIPNRINRVGIGAGDLYARGSTGGAATATTSSAGSHNHTGLTGSTALTVSQMPSHSHSGTTNVNGLHNHGGVPLLINDIDRGVDSASSLFSLDNSGQTESAGSHDHSFTTNSVGGGQSHSHSISTDGVHTHTVSTLPPYVASNFIIKT